MSITPRFGSQPMPVLHSSPDNVKGCELEQLLNMSDQDLQNEIDAILAHPAFSQLVKNQGRFTIDMDPTSESDVIALTRQHRFFFPPPIGRQGPTKFAFQHLLKKKDQQDKGNKTENSVLYALPLFF